MDAVPTERLPIPLPFWLGKPRVILGPKASLDYGGGRGCGGVAPPGRLPISYQSTRVAISGGLEDQTGLRPAGKDLKAAEGTRLKRRNGSPRRNELCDSTLP